jgi:hypothetical protein
MKIKLKNFNLPPNPTIVKWLSALTLATVSLPVWINQIPIDIGETNKAFIEWGFKGFNVLLSILAVFTKVEPEALPKYYDKTEIETAMDCSEKM